MKKEETPQFLQHPVPNSHARVKRSRDFSPWGDAFSLPNTHQSFLKGKGTGNRFSRPSVFPASSDVFTASPVNPSSKLKT